MMLKDTIITDMIDKGMIDKDMILIGYGRDGYDKNGWNRLGKNKETKTFFDKDGYDKNGFDEKGFDNQGIHRDTKEKVDCRGYGKDGFNEKGLNKDGFNREGFNVRTNSFYDIHGYDINGWNKHGKNKETHSMYDANGYTKQGFSRKKKELGGKRLHKATGMIYDEEGFDSNGYDKDGYKRNGFNDEGYDREGFNEEGFNIEGINREGKSKEDIAKEKEKIREKNEKQRRKNYLGLIDKAKKLAKGEMTLEEYVMKSTTSIEDLITFAKKQHLPAEIVKELYKYKEEYRAYTTPFKKKAYLASTILVINGKEVKPTEQDVETCIRYLKENSALICNKTVKDTIRKYLKGELKITIGKAEELEFSEDQMSQHSEESKEHEETKLEDIMIEQLKRRVEENGKTIADNEAVITKKTLDSQAAIKQALIARILKQQEIISEQLAEIAKLNSQERY